MLYSIGEILIDFMQEDDHFKPYPGGAPANVAIHAKRNGSDSLFVGKLSNDFMGSLLKDYLQAHQIYFPLDLSTLPTTLVLVSHVKGERFFQFYRNNTADLFLNTQDIQKIPFNSGDILHFCSLGLVADGTTKAAHEAAILSCTENNGIVSFDINLRASLWHDLTEAKSTILSFLSYCHILKLNEEELFWLSDKTDIEDAIMHLRRSNQLILVTLGSNGSVALTSNDQWIYTPGIPTEQIDTTGAGDAFIGTILSCLSQSPLSFIEWQEMELEATLIKANAISSQVVAQKGATPKINYDL